MQPFHDSYEEALEELRRIDLEFLDNTCHLCHVTYSSSSNLNKHLKTHDKKFPYNCPNCCCTFSRRLDMVKHFRKRHA